MIARLRGKVIEAYPNRLVVDVHGVGYEVFIPLSTFDRLHAADAGTAVRLLDDLIVYRMTDTSYLVVANASNRFAVVEALQQRAVPQGFWVRTVAASATPRTQKPCGDAAQRCIE